MSQENKSPRDKQDDIVIPLKSTLIVVGGSLAAILIIGLLVFSFALNTARLGIPGLGNSRRADDQMPRSIDIWAVYPDDTVEFVAIFTPTALTPGETVNVDIAGPLMRRNDDVIISEVFGGELLVSEILPGLSGNDLNFYYEKYTIAYVHQGEDSHAPYGASVIVTSPPYLSAEGEVRSITLGGAEQSFYHQVITAIAIPNAAEIVKNDPENPLSAASLRPYRESQVKGWHIFYFDTTDILSTNTILIRYILAPNANVQDLDYNAINDWR